MSLLLGIVVAALAGPAVKIEAAPPRDPLAELEAAQQQIFMRLAPSVVFIHTKAGFGSGFILSRDGLVLTNAHVVEGLSTVAVVTHDGQKLTGTVLERAMEAHRAMLGMREELDALPAGLDFKTFSFQAIHPSPRRHTCSQSPGSPARKFSY